MAKIVHFTSLHRAHDPRILFKECRSLAQHGYDVTLIAPHDREESLDGVTVRPFPRRHNRIAQMLFNPLQMLRAALAERADLYHFHDPQLLPVGVALKLLGKRVVYDAHEDVPAQIMSKPWIPRPLRPVVAAMTSIAERAAHAFDGVVIVTETIPARMPRARTVVVENFPRLEELGVAEAIPYQERPALVLYVGAITEARGARDMVAAMRLLAPELEARLSLAGVCNPPDLARELQQAAAGADVALLGWQDRDQVMGLLARARIGLVLLHPTPNYLRAPRATKLLEYMAAGIPAIVTDLPLMRGFVEGVGCALVVPPGDPQAVADAIRWLLEHPQEAEQMGERGRQAALSRYNWDAESQKLLKLYRRILGRNAPAAAP